MSYVKAVNVPEKLRCDTCKAERPLDDTDHWYIVIQRQKDNKIEEIVRAYCCPSHVPNYIDDSWKHVSEWPAMDAATPSAGEDCEYPCELPKGHPGRCQRGSLPMGYPSDDGPETPAEPEPWEYGQTLSDWCEHGRLRGDCMNCAFPSHDDVSDAAACWCGQPLRCAYHDDLRESGTEQRGKAATPSAGVASWPQRRILWNDAERTEIDEFVVMNPESVHVEQMGDENWWMCVTLPDGRDFHVNFFAVSKKRMTLKEQSCGWDWDQDITHEDAARPSQGAVE